MLNDLFSSVQSLSCKQSKLKPKGQKKKKKKKKRKPSQDFQPHSLEADPTSKRKYDSAECGKEIPNTKLSKMK